MQSRSKRKGETGTGTSEERIRLCFLSPGAIPLTTLVVRGIAPNYELPCPCGAVAPMDGVLCSVS